MVRSWYARHEGFPLVRSFISVGSDRLVGVVAILLILLIGTPYLYELLGASQDKYALVMVVALAGANPEDMLAISILSGIVATVAALPGSIAWLLWTNKAQQDAELDPPQRVLNSA